MDLRLKKKNCIFWSLLEFLILWPIYLLLRFCLYGVWKISPLLVLGNF